nr:NADH dehydrogenase subunit 2 [Azana sp. WQY005]
MMKNLSKKFFFLILIFSTFIILSSNSWISCWMGLEINMMTFIPLIFYSNNLMSSEASLKYFLTQALASSLFLFSVLIFLIINNFIFEIKMLNKSNISILIMITLFIKNGAAPFHFWMPSVISGLTWMNSFILMTWQKIAPMLLISYFYFNNFIILILTSSSIIGAIGGLNQTSLQKMLAYSSIFNISWMITAMMFNELLWKLYFIIYSFLMFLMIMIFNLYNIFFLNQMFSLFIYFFNLKFLFLINLLSMGGLPPFMGFFSKWMVIQSLMNFNQFFLIFILIITSMIVLYYYLRITYSAFMLNYNQSNWNLKMNFFNKNLTFILIYLMISIFSLFQFMNLIYLIF